MESDDNADWAPNDRSESAMIVMVMALLIILTDAFPTRFHGDPMDSDSDGSRG